MSLQSSENLKPEEPVEFEYKKNHLRGVSNGRSIYDKKTLIADTIDVGLYGQIAPEERVEFSGNHYLTNQELWNDLLNGTVSHGDSITLKNFDILEWLPACPGRYFTPKAKSDRDTAQEFSDRVAMEYLPLGKLQMVLGGIGSVRLAPRFIRGGEVSFYCATSNGISHQGIPIVIPIDSSRPILKMLKKDGLCSVTITGTLWPLPVDQSPISFDRGIPKYYLFAEHFKLETTSTSKPLVTIAITYNSLFKDSSTQLNTVDNILLNSSKNWSYASFNPSEQTHGLKKAVNWLKAYVSKYTIEDVFTGEIIDSQEDRISIVGDFDEYYQHFDNPVEFPLSSILSGKYNSSILDFYGRTYHITINKEVIMGDKFENIHNATIVNRSLVENSFNKVKSEFDEETANALKIVAAEIEKSGNKEAAESFDSFNEELQKPEPKKSVLKVLWAGVTAAMPALLQMTSIVTNITKLFGA